MKAWILFAYCMIVWSCSAQTTTDSIGSMKRDSQRIIGNWGLQKIHAKGVINFSTDEKDLQQIIDATWEEEEAILTQMGMTKEDVAAMVEQNNAKLAKVTFFFHEDGQLVLSTNDGLTKEERSTYKIDEKKKRIKLTQDAGKELSYLYEFKGEYLILTKENEELTFIKKTE